MVTRLTGRPISATALQPSLSSQNRHQSVQDYQSQLRRDLASLLEAENLRSVELLVERCADAEGITKFWSLEARGFCLALVRLGWATWRGFVPGT